MRKFKTPAKPRTRKRAGIHRPTIGVGEDAIIGRGPGGRTASLGKGALGENIPQSSEATSSIENIDASQSIQTGGSGDAGTDEEDYF